MADKIKKPSPKKLSKGQRTHVRRSKQAAHKEGNLTRTRAPQPIVGVPKKQDQKE